MLVTAQRSPTLISIWWPGRKIGLARAAILVFTGSLLLWASAKAEVPFWPVPLTLQTLAVLLLGTAYGGRLAAATVLLYLAEGALGLPVFAGTPERGIGVAYMMGPTGGYLIGFLLAAVVVGLLAERGAARGYVSAGLSFLLGVVLIYVPGVLWLAAMIGFEKAVRLGLFPFLLGDLVKIGLGTALFPLLWCATEARRASRH